MLGDRRTTDAALRSCRKGGCGFSGAGACCLQLATESVGVDIKPAPTETWTKLIVWLKQVPVRMRAPAQRWHPVHPTQALHPPLV
jgi:hypothetical protein